jgi:hypothetical protein
MSGMLYGQNSVLVNLGSANCNTPTPGFFLIKNPLTATPSLMTTCDLAAQLPNYFNVFIAYNPKNNKIYVADIRTGTTQIWIMDIGLPGNISCPPVIPVQPTYTYSYVSNNFEFDNNGDLWSFSNYNPLTGQCLIDKFDVTTGEVINSRILQFPLGNYPTSITSGDLTITPNGRMFATLGSGLSQLYEITNYNSNSNATATYLKTLPQNCFGIAYLNGQLEITGFDTSSCYYYDYNIGTNTLGDVKPFQNGQSPIDNASFSPALGTTKQMINTIFLNANTAEIVYELYVKNMGNTILNNINVMDDLSAAFGDGNVSDVSTTFTPGANNASLVLNPLYNGTTITNLLLPNQQLPNQQAENVNYFFKVQVSCRISNIDKSKTYFNSAIGRATVNNDVDPILVSDSSNNGTEELVDPDNDGNAGGISENIPTPFNLTLLPVKFIGFNAVADKNNSNLLTWKVTTPITGALKFEPQYSIDGVNWHTITAIPIASIHPSSYTYSHLNIPAGNIYYRIKQTDAEGQFIYSIIKLVPGKNTFNYNVYPNPANDFITISLPQNVPGNISILLYDGVGRIISSYQTIQSVIQLNTRQVPTGTYHLKITNNSQSITQKLLIKH